MAYTKTVWANSPAGTSFITATNLNKIETGLFEQDARITTTETNITALQTESSGWIVAGAMTYASANTITVASGATLIYQKGDKLRFKQGAGYKYFYIITVADTLLTVYGGTDYTVATPTAITDMYYSHETSPVGFPVYFNFTPTLSGITLGNGSIKGKIILEGTIANLYIVYTMGSTSAVTGTNVLTFPIAPNTNYSTYNLIGLGMAFAAGTGYEVIMTSGGTIYNAYVSGSNIAYRGMTATVPATWNNGSILTCEATYQIN